VTFELQDDLDTGMFRVRSGVQTGRIEEPPPVASTGRPRLVLVQSPGAGRREVVVDKEVLVVGRGSDVDVRLTDSGVSRRHAEVRREGDEVFLVDLGSTNGTQVNGRGVERVRLKSGDRIAVGRSVLVYERDDG
jgi:pSer/pThr/pTyr-binding forkhead associated (FHA) protein